MKNIKIVFTSVKKLSKIQKLAIEQMRKGCFADINTKDLEEFFAPAGHFRFGRIFIYLNKKIIGGAGLFKKYINYDGKRINFGGMGGVCILPGYQRQGFGLQIIRYAMGILKEKGCEVAILTVDLENKVYGIYEKVGFRFLKQKTTFKTSKGEEKIEDATMTAPLNSQKLYEFVINNNKPFHWGKGIW